MTLAIRPPLVEWCVVVLNQTIEQRQQLSLHWMFAYQYCKGLNSFVVVTVLRCRFFSCAFQAPKRVPPPNYNSSLEPLPPIGPECRNVTEGQTEWLFNVSADPWERCDLSRTLSQVVG